MIHSISHREKIHQHEKGPVLLVLGGEMGNETLSLGVSVFGILVAILVKSSWTLAPVAGSWFKPQMKWDSVHKA